MASSFADRLFPWMEDEEFQIQAGMELLIALGVPRTTVARLPELREIGSELEAFGEHYPQHTAQEGDGVVAQGDPEVVLAEARVRYDSILEKAYRIAEPAARETLRALDREQIRPELVGIDRQSLHDGLADIQDLYRSDAWRGGDGDVLETHLAWIRDRHRWTTEMSAPERGEVLRLVDVLREMPAKTLRRITRTRNRTILRVMLLTVLFSARRIPGGPWSSSAEPGPAS